MRARDPNFMSLCRHCPLLYPLTRLSSSLSGIISHKFPKLVRPPRKVLTRSILRRGERRRYQASEGIVLGMPDDVLLTVSHVLFLESPSFAECEILEAAAVLLETSISRARAALYGLQPSELSVLRFSYTTRLQLLAIYYYFIVSGACSKHNVRLNSVRVRQARSAYCILVVCSLLRIKYSSIRYAFRRIRRTQRMYTFCV